MRRHIPCSLLVLITCVAGAGCHGCEDSTALSNTVWPLSDLADQGAISELVDLDMGPPFSPDLDGPDLAPVQDMAGDTDLEPPTPRFTHIAAGDAQTCALDEDHVMWCWGDNLKSLISADAPRFLSSPWRVRDDVRELALGPERICVVTLDDELVCWGSNRDGALGTGPPTSLFEHEAPTLILEDVRSVSLGRSHSCAVTLGDRLFCWGQNKQGQLGEGSLEPRYTPTLVPLDRVRDMSLGGSHTCATTREDVLYCWGHNASHSFGRPDSSQVSSPVRVAGGVARVSAGGAHTCFVTRADEMFCAGHNRSGQLGDGSTQDRADFTLVMSPVRELTAGFSHTCATHAVTNRLSCWGENRQGQVGTQGFVNSLSPQEVMPEEVAHVNAGTPHTCAILLDGRVRCWGSHESGQLGVGNGPEHYSPVQVMTGVQDVVAGPQNACAILQDGTLSCWGLNADGQLDAELPERVSLPHEVDEEVSHAALGAQHRCVLNAQGVLSCQGRDVTGPHMDERIVEVDGVQTRQPIEAIALKAGHDSTCVVTPDARLECWGLNEHGQLGTGPGASVVVQPTEVLENVRTMSMNRRLSCGLTLTDELWCWGQSMAGHVGDLTVGDNPLPVMVLEEIRQVAVGQRHVCVVSLDGDLGCWGTNADGQLGGQDSGRPAGRLVAVSSGVKQAAVGAKFSCDVLEQSAEMRCWGAGAVGASGYAEPSLTPRRVEGLAGVDKLVAGDEFVCALMLTGELYCWGANQQGQLGTGYEPLHPRPVDVTFAP